MRGSNVLAVVLILIGLLAVPFIRDAVGPFVLLVFVGGTVVLMVLFVIVGSLMMLFRGA